MNTSTIDVVVVASRYHSVVAVVDGRGTVVNCCMKDFFFFLDALNLLLLFLSSVASISMFNCSLFIRLSVCPSFGLVSSLHILHQQ